MVKPVSFALLRPVAMMLVAFSLVGGLVGGLIRAGAVSNPAAPWALSAAAWHAALMMPAFFGAVIGIERAVAVRARWAYLAPLASALGGVGLLTGHLDWDRVCFVLAATVFVAVNALIVRRQSAPHTWLLLGSAIVLWLANGSFAWTGMSEAVLAAWFAFLVLTIAAERLEMSRLMRRHPAAHPLLGVVLLALSLGLVGSWMGASWAGGLFGISLVGLAAWLGAFDVARRTIHTQGLSRYMAVCLLLGYAWLAVAGLCWWAHDSGGAYRDAALHALGLGFVMSMVMGHAPVILPAVARIKVHYDARFYLPLAALHASLLLRLLGGHASAQLKAWGAGLNVASLVLFVLTMVTAAISWQRRHRRHS